MKSFNFLVVVLAAFIFSSNSFAGDIFCEGQPNHNGYTGIIQVHVYPDPSLGPYRAEVALYTSPTFIPSPPPPNFNFAAVYVQGEPATFLTSDGRFQLHLSNPAVLKMKGQQFEVDCSQQ